MTDLQKFILLFAIPCKSIRPGVIEYRVQDLDARLHEANRIIASRNLGLKAECIGNMSSMRAFWVREVEI